MSESLQRNAASVMPSSREKLVGRAGRPAATERMILISGEQITNIEGWEAAAAAARGGASERVSGGGRSCKRADA